MGSGRAAKEAARKNAYKKRKRAALLPNAYTIPRKVSEKATFAQIRTDFDLNVLLVDQIAIERETASFELFSLETLKSDPDNSYMAWDGTPHALTSGAYVFAALPGWPLRESSWPEAVKDFNKLALRIRSAAEVTGGHLIRDGIIRLGVSCGLGRARPTNLPLPPGVQNMLQELHGQGSRIPAFASCSLASLAPKLFRAYADKLHGMFERMPMLQRIVSKSVFPTASLDFTNGRPCRAHDGHPNGAMGWCALFAGGDFDPSAGGHLFLPQANLIIEFPPGATILIPSTLVYGIVPVPTGQTRYTFSQYIPVDVVRYIDNGYRTRCDMFKERAVRGDDASSQPLKSKIQQDLELLSRFDELHSDRMSSALAA